MRWFALCAFVLVAPGCKKAGKVPAETERAAMRAPQTHSAEVARPLKRWHRETALLARMAQPKKPQEDDSD